MNRSVRDFTQHRKIKACPVTFGIGLDQTKGDEALWRARVAKALPFVDTAGRLGCDIIVLSEEFPGNLPVDPRMLVELLAPKARQYHMYIIAGLRALLPKDGPMGVYTDPNGTHGVNSAVVIDRAGEYLGSYHKQWPCCGGGSRDGFPGRDGTRVFDLDFGRIAIMTCFDMNFAESWHAAYAQGAEVVFWPSAYGGGYPLRAYSSLYGYRIVPAGWGDVRDITGEVVDGLQRHCNGTQAEYGTSDCGYGRPNMSSAHPDYSNLCDACVFVAELDLDKQIVHSDMGNAKINQLLKDYEGLLEEEFNPEYCAEPGKCAGIGDLIWEANQRLLRLTDAGHANESMSVRKLMHENRLPTLRAYQQWSRMVINAYRQEGNMPAAEPESVEESADAECVSEQEVEELRRENERLREELLELRALRAAPSP
jgi:hypothetical protein